MKRSRNISLKDVISWVMLSITLLAILAGVLFFAVFTNGFKGDFKEFYVTVRGENERAELVTESKDLDVYLCRKYRIEPKYVMNLLSKNKKLDYSVTIAPNITEHTDFEFTVGDQSVTYSQVKDLSEVISIEKHDGYFVLEIDDDLPAMLKKLYRTDNVQGVPSAVDSYEPYISVKIYSDGNKACVTLRLLLCAKDIKPTETTTDPSQIVF